MAGKGSSPRPVDYAKFGKGYEHAFRKDRKTKEHAEALMDSGDRMIQEDAPRKQVTGDSLFHASEHAVDLRYLDALDVLGLTSEDFGPDLSKAS